MQTHNMGEVMTVETLYDVIGGDYAKIIQNLKQDEKVARFAQMFLQDSSYQELKDAMDGQDYEAAFAAAHKLKGICQNMYFDRMQHIVSDITEGLRGGADILSAVSLMPQLEAVYEMTVENILQLD